MVRARCTGTMAHATMANGSITRLTGSAYSIILTATSSKGTGPTTKPMVSAFICTRTELSTRVSGSKTSKTG